MQVLPSLFDITSLMPHGYCLVWNSVLLWLHVFSDALIALAYYSIPLIMFYFIRKHKEFPFNNLLLLFAAFIIACGTTHVLSIITIWMPLYWLEGLLKFVTGLISLFTAIAMIVVIPKVLAEIGRNQHLKALLVSQANEMQEQLTKQVAERTEELQVSTEQAQAALKIKRAFLSNMSHEIRTPINAIMSISHLTLQTDLSAQQHNYLTKIDSSAKWLLGILDDILNFSKLETGKVSLEHSDFELSSVMLFLQDVTPPLLKDKPVKLNFDIDAAIPAVLIGDSLRLGQILLNLLSNAIKFTSEGSITLQVQLLSLDIEQVGLRFAITDTGIGLNLAQQGELFEAFNQADNSTTRLYGGTGLGLSISKELVSAMGGHIVVESQEGVGSCFSFIITFEIGVPIINLELPIAASKRLDTYPSLRNVRVLVVEDNELIREFIPDIMGYEGIQVDLANNGVEALDFLTINDYAAVLMDCQMPVMDGFEATRRIRANPRFAKLPIIAMTGNVFDQERELCLACGMNDFISKPVDWDHVFLTLERWITDPEGQVAIKNKS
jgi:signal transduction histidine kinase/ActR/RegA family two-component response regulator